MPGIGVRTAARILLEIGDASVFASSAHLAAYAGIAPVTHRSGSSIRGEHPARTGNRKLRHVDRTTGRHAGVISVGAGR